MDRLLEQLFDPGLTPEDWGELRGLLASSQAARARYARWVDLHSTLTWEMGTVDSRLWILELEAGEREQNILGETMVLPALQAEPADEALPAMDPYRPPFWLAPRQAAAARRRKRAVRRWQWRAAAALFIILVSAVVFTLLRGTPSQTPPVVAKSAKPVKTPVPAVPVEPPILAQVVKQVDARWESAQAPENAALREGRSFVLMSGYVEIRFTSGATLVIEGPTEFSLESASALSVTTGRLTATVHNGGFIVDTPSARVTDLGTEFGVGVGQDRNTEVAVFLGKVETALPASGGQAQNTILLAGGQAAVVTSSSMKLDEGGANVQRFVRHLYTDAMSLDVVDLVAGGDGTTHRRGLAIDPTTGKAGALKPAEMYMGDHHYHRVSSLPVVDGCFVPDETNGLTVVDSAAHTYRFPVTKNEGFNHIWTGGAIPDAREIMPTVLGKIDYAKEDHALLSMHSNKALTLDLNAIRRLHPGLRLARLRSIVGNAHVAATADEWRPHAEAFVLVDGTPRYASGIFTPDNGAMPVDVALDDNDRFITFAVTDGEDGTTYDWVLWGDPHFDLVER